jgi:ubiquinone/menaquinone biosynthesis C-methylase UbiE
VQTWSVGAAEVAGPVQFQLLCLLGHILNDYLKPYGDIEMQRRMVSDRPRTNAFAAAINEVVQSGDVVLDVGTGTGILAMFAAKAGAQQVYAVDVTDIAEVASELVKINGLSDQIQVIRGRASDLQLDQTVDLIISEWLGNAAFGEGMLPAVLDARDRYLKPNGRMLPAKVRVMIAPLDEPFLYNAEGPGIWRERIHDLDFSSLQEAELLQGRTIQTQIDHAAVLASAQPILELDLHAASPEDVLADCQLTFVPVRDAVLNGFCVWFEADLSPNVMLDTGPFSPETHWAQMYMSFMPRPVCTNEPLEVNVEFSFESEPDGGRGYVDLHLGVGEDELDFIID